MEADDGPQHSVLYDFSDQFIRDVYVFTFYSSQLLLSNLQGVKYLCLPWNSFMHPESAIISKIKIVREHQPSRENSLLIIRSATSLKAHGMVTAASLL